MKVQDIESKMEENSERVKVLISLMTKGYLEPALFNKQNNDLRLEVEKLKEQKEILYRSINGGMNMQRVSYGYMIQINIGTMNVPAYPSRQ